MIYQKITILMSKLQIYTGGYPRLCLYLGGVLSLALCCLLFQFNSLFLFLSFSTLLVLNLIYFVTRYVVSNSLTVDKGMLRVSYTAHKSSLSELFFPLGNFSQEYDLKRLSYVSTNGLRLLPKRISLITLGDLRKGLQPFRYGQPQGVYPNYCNKSPFVTLVFSDGTSRVLYSGVFSPTDMNKVYKTLDSYGVKVLS
jgi:hypothetical protein